MINLFWGWKGGGGGGKCKIFCTGGQLDHPPDKNLLIRSKFAEYVRENDGL